ncbi:MAG: p-hydroxycinnamoyl CoA hydratase/lyase [Firmicutes bacterium]|nr:p-hydroxycinnamoyl CoA hydratase/lyase [Alicyclobacillaceae bacterium]MCL6497364.1 p-hydroxycinnamoyl CoA hydratase/lyase [Bacillota bacterium]
MGVIQGQYEAVRVEQADGITWVILNRPEKRNAMNPTMNREMVAVLTELAVDSDTAVLVLTGAGEAFSAGMDLKEFFRDLDDDPAGRWRARQDAHRWQVHLLRNFPKPTIAMVNGWCFGGAFTPLISCDLAVAAEDAVFGLSEVNWGIIPGGYVTKDLSLVMSFRDVMYYVMTGKTFDGKKAAEMRLVNEAVPREVLRERVVELARHLQRLNPYTVKACKEAVRATWTMSTEQAFEYLWAKQDQLRWVDQERGRDRALRQFLDEKRFRAGLESYDRTR